MSKTPGTPLLPHEVTSRSLLAPFLNLRRIWATNFSLSNNFTENKSTYAMLLKSLLRFYVAGQRAVARSPSLCPLHPQVCGLAHLAIKVHQTMHHSAFAILGHRALGPTNLLKSGTPVPGRVGSTRSLGHTPQPWSLHSGQRERSAD